MVPRRGIEPLRSGLQPEALPTELSWRNRPGVVGGSSAIPFGLRGEHGRRLDRILERAGRIELPQRPWQGRALPLSYARMVPLPGNDPGQPKHPFYRRRRVLSDIQRRLVAGVRFERTLPVYETGPGPDYHSETSRDNGARL